MTRAPLAVVVHASAPTERLPELARGLPPLAGRAVELIVAGAARELEAARALADGRAPAAASWRFAEGAHDAATPALRNAALACAEAAGAAYAVFLDERALESTFLAQACRVLDRRPDAAFVTAWLAGVPARAGSLEQPVPPAALLARPWFAHVPTVLRVSAWRAAGGFDERMIGCDDVDLLIRLVDAGGAALAIAEARLPDRAWGAPFDWLSDGAEAAARRLFERHAARFDEAWDATLTGMERITRELYGERAPADARVIERSRELERVEAERARVDAVLARLPRR
jgi:hypothetical protein